VFLLNIFRSEDYKIYSCLKIHTYMKSLKIGILVMIFSSKKSSNTITARFSSEGFDLLS